MPDVYMTLLYVMLGVAALVFIGTFLISVVGVFKDPRDR